MPVRVMNVLRVSGSYPGISQRGWRDLLYAVRRSLMHAALSQGCIMEIRPACLLILNTHTDTLLLERPHLDDQSTVVFICLFESCIQKASPVSGQKRDSLTRERS